jgi:ABC-2 type transport system ATP-binding protein
MAREAPDWPLGAPGGSAPAVAVEDLVVTYGELRAVDGISFTANRGEVLCLLGPNGAGKTTTVSVLEGYRKPDSGRARVLGMDPIKDHKALVPRTGLMLQEGGVYPTMTPKQAMELFASYYDDPEDPQELLELLELSRVARTPFRSLSGGEQRRLSLALALIGKPEVAFLDEPTSGVDPEGRLVIRKVIEALARVGCCVIMTTHELDIAERVADEVVMINHGILVASGSPTELARKGAAPGIRFRSKPKLNTVELGRELLVRVVEEHPGEYRVEVPALSADARFVSRLTSWLARQDLPLQDLRVGARTLEETYLSLMAEAERQRRRDEDEEDGKHK